MSTNEPGLNPAAGGGDLDPDHFDPRLKRALGQAPDRAELPDWRVRRAILDQAHEAVSASEALLAASRKRTGWRALRSWLRGRDDEGRRTRGVPWGAALATVAVAVLATLIWQHEPLPGAAPARPGAMTESRSQEAVPAAPPAAPPTPTEPTTPAAAPAPVAAADEVAGTPAPAPASPAQSPPPSGTEPAAAERPPLSPSQMQRLAQSQSQSRAAEAAPQAAEKAESPAITGPAPERAAAAATATAKDSAAAAAAAAASAAAVPAGTAIGADAPAAALAPAPPPPPDYSSLARWTELRIAHVSGDVRVLSRARAGGLVGLLNTAAAQPQGPGEVMRGLAYFRVMLERRGETLALLEVGGNQLRWTEGGSVPVTSRPPPADLAALENALRTALRGSGAPRAPN